MINLQDNIRKHSLELKIQQCNNQYLTPDRSTIGDQMSNSRKNSGSNIKNNVNDSTQPQTLQKDILSMSNSKNTNINIMEQSVSSNNSRRFSFFSKTSFATCNSMTFGIRKSQKNNIPKVKIGNIIKNRANLYHDEDLEHTFDTLLEKAYDIVNNKKIWRDLLKEEFEAINQEINSIKLEFQPLQSQIQKLEEKIHYYKDLQRKIETEQLNHKKEVQKLQFQLDSRSQDISQQENKLLEQIKSLEIQNNQIRSNIQLNKQDHKLQRDNIEKEIKQKNKELDALAQILSNCKNKYETSKYEQATKLRKMENKSKMFLGILKH